MIPLNVVSSKLGGPRRTKIIGLFALILALDGANIGAVGAMSDILENYFIITKTHLGLLLTASALSGAVAMLFYGWLVDRVKRTRLLSVIILLWGGAMIGCGAAMSYASLLVAHVAVGALAAAAIPAVASLVGDLFDPAERGVIFSYILSGEMIGTGAGYVISGELAALWWRLGFWILAVPAVFLAWTMARIDEPARGGGGRLKPEGARADKGNAVPNDQGNLRGKDGADYERIMTRKVREARIFPREGLVLDENPGEKSLWWAVGYVLRVPTNIVLIISSALGYCFFAGARTFGVQFVSGRYGLGHSAAIWTLMGLGTGALIGVLTIGRMGDALLSSGDFSGRVKVATYAYLASAFLFLPSLLSPSLWVGIPTLFCATAALGGANPSLDAARLDIMHPYLWGRAEAIRAMLRQGAQAAAPLLFGYVATNLDDGSGAKGLRDAFLMMLIPLFLGGVIGSFAFRTYPRDVATAQAYARRTRENERARR
jgi:MFS family permease